MFSTCGELSHIHGCPVRISEPSECLARESRTCIRAGFTLSSPSKPDGWNASLFTCSAGFGASPHSFCDCSFSLAPSPDLSHFLPSTVRPSDVSEDVRKQETHRREPNRAKPFSPEHTIRETEKSSLADGTPSPPPLLISYN